MNRRPRISPLVGLLGLAIASCAKPPPPKAPAQPPAAAPPSAAQPAPAVAPEALAALERMGAFLRAQRAFAVRATTETDEVLASGQKIQLSGRTFIDVQRPDHLRAERTSDRKQREFYYDGKTFTIYAPRMRYYATVPAPPTLEQLVDYAETHYGIDLPLADLFYWGTDKAKVGEITSAIDVGPATIDGVETEQYAFRQPGLDWQIWIQRGDRPLPRKLVLTTTSDPRQPQHVVVMSWDLTPLQNARTFEFVPPGDAQRIELTPPVPEGGVVAQRETR